MTQKGLGQYDKEYFACSCFWGSKPGKLTRLLEKYLTHGHILDLGAGEGKNAIYLAQRGFEVTAVECSEYAINNFNRRLSKLDNDLKSKIQIVRADVRNYLPKCKYEAVVSYGLLHCLPGLNEILNVIRLMQKYTVNGGYNVIVALSNKIHVPIVQDYLQVLDIPDGYITDLYKEWKIISFEDTILEEKHPTSNILHKHSIIRLLAQKQ